MLTPTSVAHVIPFRASRGWDSCTHSLVRQGKLYHYNARVLVAQSHFNFRNGDWVEEGITTFSALCNAASSITSTALQHVLGMWLGGHTSREVGGLAMIA